MASGIDTDDNDVESIEIYADRTDDGRIMAGGYRGYVCANSNHFHIDLLDNKGQPFATFFIEEGDVEEVARKLFAFAAKIAMDRLYDDDRRN